MNLDGAAVLEQAGEYAHLFDRVSTGPIRLASDQELIDELDAVSRLIRLAESERAKLAGEIARRSDTRDPATFLARRLGTTG